NIPFLQYINVLSLEESLSLNTTILIDMFLVLGTVFFCTYWDRVPADIAPEKIVMKKVKRWYLLFISFLLLIIVNCFTMDGTTLSAVVWMGGSLNELHERIGQSLNACQSIPEIFGQNYGVIGLILWFVCVLLFGKRLLKQQKKSTNKLYQTYCLLGWIFLIQSFFYKFTLCTAPEYIVFFSLALNISDAEELK
ncbi:MAG TPA: hypothetical protein H9831_12935, partial [Candidatus Eisenbergiella pullistercoris]|nr:hypothetical protein [Candidatus Eisenbergiella pullistercoris]